MFTTNDEKINGFLFVIILPFLLYFMSYYGFESSYARLKTMEKAPAFMFSSVYAYRVIPNYLSVHGTELLTSTVNTYVPFMKNFLLKQGTLFYHSTFLINSFFFLLSSVILNSIFGVSTSGMPTPLIVRRVLHLLAVFFLVITQYVPTNCDSIATFFYLLGCILTFKYLQKKRRADFVLLIIVIAVSTFVRETACLIISFFAAVFVNFEKLKKKDFSFMNEIFILAVAFAIPYIALRMIINQEVSLVEGIYLFQNFTSLFNMSGLMFAVISVYFCYQLCNEEGKSLVKKYIFFSLPYLLMITVVGLFWEVRLFVPIILTGLIFVSYQFKIQIIKP